MFVKYDGVIGRYKHTPYLVDLVNTGSVMIPDLKINISERFFDPGKRDLLYIPYSGVAKLHVFGNLVNWRDLHTRMNQSKILVRN